MCLYLSAMVKKIYGAQKSDNLDEDTPKEVLMHLTFRFFVSLLIERNINYKKHNKYRKKA